MARRKKKEGSLIPKEKLVQALVAEETLAQAMVPNWGQPYKVPENWCWVRQSVVCSLVDGKKMDGKDYPYWEVKALRGTKDTQYVSEGKFVNKGTKVILVDGENSGEVFDIPMDGYMGSTFKALQISTVVHWDYLRFFITTKQELYRNNKKGSAIPHLNKELFFNMPFPLAPYAEQQRIVDRIGILLAKLDAARMKTQAVLDSFETRKSSILHKAFSGELTAKWRAEHNIGMDSWETLTYSNLGDSKLGKMLDKAKNEGLPVPYLRNVNVRWFSFDLNDLSTMLASEEEISSLSVKQGDLFICEGGEPGRCAIWKEPDSNLIFQKALHRFRPNEKVISAFLCYNLYFMSLNGTLEKFFTGTTIKHLTGQSLAKIPVSLPSVSEQAEIVRILDSIFTREQQAKEAAEVVLEEIDLTKKAILFRAFRGELGTNDPTESSAVELIKQLLSENIAIKEPKIPRVRKKPEVAFVTKTIMQALVEKGKTTPEKLKAETDLQIDDFYDQLKFLIDNGQVVETRVDGEPYLEAKNADRQPNN